MGRIGTIGSLGEVSDSRTKRFQVRFARNDVNAALLLLL